MAKRLHPRTDGLPGWMATVGSSLLAAWLLNTLFTAALVAPGVKTSVGYEAFLPAFLLAGVLFFVMIVLGSRKRTPSFEPKVIYAMGALLVLVSLGVMYNTTQGEPNRVLMGVLGLAGGIAFPVFATAWVARLAVDARKAPSYMAGTLLIGSVLVPVLGLLPPAAKAAFCVMLPVFSLGIYILDRRERERGFIGNFDELVAGDKKLDLGLAKPYLLSALCGALMLVVYSVLAGGFIVNVTIALPATAFAAFMVAALMHVLFIGQGKGGQVRDSYVRIAPVSAIILAILAFKVEASLGLVAAAIFGFGLFNLAVPFLFAMDDVLKRGKSPVIMVGFACTLAAVALLVSLAVTARMVLFGLAEGVDPANGGLRVLSGISALVTAVSLVLMIVFTEKNEAGVMGSIRDAYLTNRVDVQAAKGDLKQMMEETEARIAELEQVAEGKKVPKKKMTAAQKARTHLKKDAAAEEGEQTPEEIDRAKVNARLNEVAKKCRLSGSELRFAQVALTRDDAAEVLDELHISQNVATQIAADICAKAGVDSLGKLVR